MPTNGENCAAMGLEDIMDLDDCVAARNKLGFPHHSSVIKDTGGLTNRPHGCTVQSDGLIRLYPAGTQACTTSGMKNCLCKIPETTGEHDALLICRQAKYMDGHIEC